MATTTGYYLIQSTGWGKVWHILKGGREYADWFRARCGRSFDSEYAQYARAGIINLEDLCSRCARSIGDAADPGGIISLGERPRNWPPTE